MGHCPRVWCNVQRVAAQLGGHGPGLLRAIEIKGILEQITTSQVNIVNADLLAKKRGLRIVETCVKNPESNDRP